MLILVTLLGSVFCLSFVVLSLGAGLYYLAEFAEERPSITRRWLNYLFYVVASLHFGMLVVDRLPFLRLLYSAACLLACAAILPEFPAVEYTSPVFLVAIAMSLVNHFQWFVYFIGSGTLSIYQISSFFMLVVWAVPLGILVSLVSPSSYLPTADPKAPKRQSAIKAFLNQFDLLSSFSESNTRLSNRY